MRKTTKSLMMVCATVMASLTSSAQTVMLDNYFNQETKKDQQGKQVRFHYQWDETASSGFSIFGDAFKKNGAKALKTLSEVPNATNLKDADIFIIVDPDNLKDNPNPNYMTEAAAVDLANWVKGGGVLLLMANDKVNADLEHLNILTTKFGFEFNNDLILHVTDDEHFADGGLDVSNNPLFKTAKQIFIKDASSIAIKHSAKALLTTADGKNVMVSSSFGKGTVLAVGDPWLYNEYVNGRLPAKYENDKAAADVSAWLIQHSRKSK